MDTPTLSPALSGASVLRRTDRGAQELLATTSTLTPAERRLLARLNGFTDLATLLALAPAAGTTTDLAQRLLDEGFAEIEP